MRPPLSHLMSHDVAIIAPELELFRLAKSLRDETPVNYSVYLASVESAHKIAPKAVAAGAKVLISRGISTEIIRNLNLPVPVLDILVSEHDTVSMLGQARAYSPHVAVVGFDGLIKAAQKLAPLLSVDVGIFQVRSMREIYTSTQQAKEEGYTVLVGNSYAVTCAKRLGLMGVPMQTPPANFLSVIAEAGKVAEALAREAEWRIRQHVLINSVSESIITIDEDGTLATDSVPLPSRSAALVDTLGGQEPIRHLLEHHGVLAAIRGGHMWEGEVMAESGDSYQLRALPVQSGPRDRGAILLVSLTTTTVERDRRKLFQKGFVARYQLDDVLHRSTTMRTLLDRAKQYAVSEAPLFVQGESGTGKEMLAQGVHNASRRRYGPFIGISCAAIPESLLESELFGYQEGAFTGARKSGKPGLLELADTGTLFLDEVAEISLQFQAKLLRVLEEQAFMRVGGDRVIRTDVRIICATNRDLAAMVNAGRFRLDLYYRLNTLRVHIPPLRERPEDIAPLAEHAIREVSKRLDKAAPAIAPDVLRVLLAHPFPGNARELFGLFERTLAATNAPLLTAAMISEHLDTAVSLPDARKTWSGQSDSTPEQLFTPSGDQDEALRQALRRANGNKGKAAQLLGISATTLWRRLKRLEENTHSPKK